MLNVNGKLKIKKYYLSFFILVLHTLKGMLKKKSKYFFSHKYYYYISLKKTKTNKIEPTKK
jgi:hypothetical protein